jgi:uncharacterized protein
MKFQPDSLDGVNTIARHDGGHVWVGGQAHAGNLIVPWRGPVRAWSAASFDAMSAADFEALLADQPELVIFGSGARLRFPKPALLRSLIEHGIGVETMDTAAACRTYNVLVNEGRTVVAALLVERV